MKEIVDEEFGKERRGTRPQKEKRMHPTKEYRRLRRS
jgi:hypothetical protein